MGTSSRRLQRPEVWSGVGLPSLSRDPPKSRASSHRSGLGVRQVSVRQPKTTMEEYNQRQVKSLIALGVLAKSPALLGCLICLHTAEVTGSIPVSPTHHSVREHWCFRVCRLVGLCRSAAKPHKSPTSRRPLKPRWAWQICRVDVNIYSLGCAWVAVSHDRLHLGWHPPVDDEQSGRC